MAQIQPQLVTTGGSIHLKYAPGDNTGICDPTFLSISLDISPRDEHPWVMVSLELPPGNYRFKNNALRADYDFYLRAHQGVVQPRFQVVCAVSNPVGPMLMQVRSWDAGLDNPVPGLLTVSLGVKTEVTSLADVRATFLNT